MAIIGYILLAVGAILALLDYTTFIDVIPPLANLNVPIVVWIAVAIVGGVLAMMYRRARD